ncbi:Na(+)/H(+) antiporter subunit C [Desulfuribacillus stibiiarsenatis]|uniref:Na(+)/H(+) antiporter subunit C n=1 Tax=Desulfuribacillus stibiiarsenatis TaxID=1390249 RepID=A0A1E5L3C8_9FIRM|nr:Na(+)/H(+) antiporter subunit C [Desulfuribacillus stibiiarsenatis]OEH84581.1 Na(+)/H(+) antiporter subunit C [Desulfuribacillus stibiiarsenatis]
MEIIMSIVAGVLFGCGVYLLLDRSLLRVVFGTMLASNAALVLLLTMGGLKTGSAPILLDSISVYTDPIPHALILTAIVIGFGMSSFILVLAYRTYQEAGTDDLDKLRGVEDE